jgi:hypothetical protein
MQSQFSVSFGGFPFALPVRITPTTAATFIADGARNTLVSCYELQSAAASTAVRIERVVTRCGCSSEPNQ